MMIRCHYMDIISYYDQNSSRFLDALATVKGLLGESIMWFAPHLGNEHEPNFRRSIYVSKRNLYPYVAL